MTGITWTSASDTLAIRDEVRRREQLEESRQFAVAMADLERKQAWARVTGAAKAVGVSVIGVGMMFALAWGLR